VSIGNWFFIRQGRRFGPFLSQELKQLAVSGQLCPSDTVWKEGTANWVLASQVRGLPFAQSHSIPEPMVGQGKPPNEYAENLAAAFFAEGESQAHPPGPVLDSTTLPAEAIPQIPFACPFCGESYTVARWLARQHILCRNCNGRSQVEVVATDKRPRPLPAKETGPFVSSTKKKPKLVLWTIGISAVAIVLAGVLVLVLQREQANKEAVKRADAAKLLREEQDATARAEAERSRRLIEERQYEEKENRIVAAQRRLEQTQSNLERTRIALAADQARRQQATRIEQLRKEAAAKEAAEAIKGNQRQAAQKRDRYRKSEQAKKRMTDYYLSLSDKDKEVTMIAWKQLMRAWDDYVAGRLTGDNAREILYEYRHVPSVGREIVYLLEIGADGILGNTEKYSQTYKEAWGAVLEASTKP
jgi:GYF domain 2